MNFEQIKPDYTSTHFQVLEETVQKNVQTAAENKPTGFVAADHRNLKLGAWLLLVVGGFCSVFSAITFVTDTLFHAVTGQSITTDKMDSPLLWLSGLMAFLLLGGFEVVKTILIKEVANTKLYSNRIKLVPTLLTIAVLAFSAFTSIKGGGQLAIISANIKAKSVEQIDVTNTRDTYNRDIEATQKGLKELTSRKGLTWRGKLTPKGEEEYKRLQSRIDYLTQQRDAQVIHDENYNDTKRNEVLLEGLKNSSDMKAFATAIEIMILVCGLYLAWFYFKINMQHNTVINKTHAVSGAKEYTQVIESVNKIDNTVITDTDIDSLLQRLAVVERNLKTAQSQARQIEEGILKDRNIETVQSRIDRLEAERKELKAQIQGHSAKDYH